MNPGRARVRGVLRIASLAAAVALAGLVGLARDSGAAPGPWSFPHAPHLKLETVAAARAAVGAAGERVDGQRVDDADCRACHDYATTGDRHDVKRAETCDDCHLGEAYLEVKLAPGPRAERRAFPHAAHVKDPSISCFTCHALLEDQGWIEFSIPADGFGTRGRGGRPGGPNGTATCADCHAEHEPSGGKVKHDETTGDGKRCATCHGSAASILPLRHRPLSRDTGARSGGPRAFLHADHGGAAADCAACHAAMARSHTVWDSKPVDAAEETCRACHVGAKFERRSSLVPFVQFERFDHAEHLKPAGKVETSHEGTPDCRTCHFPQPERSEPVGRGALLTFDACVTCHDTWRVEGHGVGAWACFKCHTGDVGEDGRRATARVDRARIDVTRLLSVHHPEITTRGPRLAGAVEPSTGKRCADCHVAGLESLASRLSGKRFAHRPHVPGEPAVADCLACHWSVVDARRSGDMRRFDIDRSAPLATRDGARARTCGECHIGTSEGRYGGHTRDVPEFDHGGHVRGAPWKGGTGIACTECHDAGSDVGYTTPADVASCTRCHSHDEQQPEKRARTGPSTSAGSAAACVHCHASVGDGAGLGAPAGADETSRRRSHALLLSGTQFHDKTGACATCHYRDAREGAAPWKYAERVTSARPLGSIHDDPDRRDAWFNDPNIQTTPDAQERTCATCHRREPDGYLRALESR